MRTMATEYHHTPIFALPPEVLVHVFSYIDSKTICMELTRVCRLFYDILEDPVFWRVYLKNIFGDDRETRSDVRFCEAQGGYYIRLKCRISEIFIDEYRLTKKKVRSNKWRGKIWLAVLRHDHGFSALSNKQMLAVLQ